MSGAEVLRTHRGACAGCDLAQARATALATKAADGCATETVTAATDDLDALEGVLAVGLDLEHLEHTVSVTVGLGEVR